MTKSLMNIARNSNGGQGETKEEYEGNKQ